jgi:MYXO-CTERM domain-containing protein
MDAAGGLGTTCTKNSDCMSGSCASDGTNMYCVVSCNPATQGACPSGFGCQTVGTGGVCWPGADSGGGSSGCTTGGAGGGEILFGLGFAGVLLARRRRR